jgi:hypothetical protein
MKSVALPKAFPLLMESEAGLYDFDLTRFLDANRYPLRSKTLWQRVRTPRLASVLSDSSCFILRQDETAWRSTEPNR